MEGDNLYSERKGFLIVESKQWIRSYKEQYEGGKHIQAVNKQLFTYHIKNYVRKTVSSQ